MDSKIRDDSMWELAITGDQVAFEAILSQYQGLAIAGARKAGISSKAGLDSGVDDAAQNALIYAYECWLAGNFRDMDEGQFRSWLYNQGSRRAIMIVRKNRRSMRDCRRTQTIGELQIVGKSSDCSQIELTEMVQEIYQTFAADHAILDAIQAGKQLGELASELNVSEWTLRARLLRLRKKARKLAAEATE